MTWFKLDDRFFDNPKIAALSDRAKVAYLEAGTYCARELTDGLVPTQKARAFAASSKALKELTPHLWEPVDGGFRVHDYLKYNPTREQVIAEREAAKKRMFGVRSGRSSPERSGEQRANVQGEVRGTPVTRNPLAPLVLSADNQPDQRGGPSLDNGAGAPDGDAIPPHLAKQKRETKRKLTEDDVLGMYDLFPQLDVQREATKFRDYVVAKRPKYVDEPAAFRNWLRRAEEDGHGRNQNGANARQSRPTTGANHERPSEAARRLGIGGGR